MKGLPGRLPEGVGGAASSRGSRARISSMLSVVFSVPSCALESRSVLGCWILGKYPFGPLNSMGFLRVLDDLIEASKSSRSFWSLASARSSLGTCSGEVPFVRYEGKALLGLGPCGGEFIVRGCGLYGSTKRVMLFHGHRMERFGRRKSLGTCSRLANNLGKVEADVNDRRATWFCRAPKLKSPAAHSYSTLPGPTTTLSTHLVHGTVSRHQLERTIATMSVVVYVGHGGSRRCCDRVGFAPLDASTGPQRHQHSCCRRKHDQSAFATTPVLGMYKETHKLGSGPASYDSDIEPR